MHKGKRFLICIMFILSLPNDNSFIVRSSSYNLSLYTYPPIYILINKSKNKQIVYTEKLTAKYDNFVSEYIPTMVYEASILEIRIPNIKELQTVCLVGCQKKDIWVDRASNNTIVIAAHRYGYVYSFFYTDSIKVGDFITLYIYKDKPIVHNVEVEFRITDILLVDPTIINFDSVLFNIEAKDSNLHILIYTCKGIYREVLVGEYFKYTSIL